MKKAFTLAEVMITMAVIGIVTIIVLPTFMANYHRRVFAENLKNHIIR